MASHKFRMLTVFLGSLVVSAGCNRSTTDELAQARAEAETLRAEAQTLKAELARMKGDADTARNEAKAAREELAKLTKPAEGSDRRAAEWVLRIGGNMTALVDGVPTEFKKGETLPAEGKSVKIIRVQVAANPQVRDEGLQNLKGLDLEELDLHHNSGRVSDLRFVEGMKRLKTLSLALSVESDDALKSLRDTPSLENLHMFGCKKVTDAGLVHLSELRGLKILDIRETGVSDAGRAKLQAALPMCRFLK